ncbi:MAG: oxidoreductase [Gammaproteobacteria bacterium]|nr:oxidoreductase [Gammaproteobacteria bacterium]
MITARNLFRDKSHMKKSILGIFLLNIFLFPLAHAATDFVEGQDYRTLSSEAAAAVAAIAPADPNRIQVVEFFSYGCPACYRLEPSIEAFTRKTPSDVDFGYVPVTFHPGWDRYAKAFYTAKSLGILNKMTPAIFTAIHVKQNDLSADDAMAAVFTEYGGIDKQQFNAIFNHSPALDIDVAKGDRLMQIYGINVVPSIVIAQHYVTSPAMTQGDTRLFEVINFLINKEKAIRKI